MLPFHDHHNLLDRSSSEQLELNPHPLSPGEFCIPLSPPSFYIPEEGLHDLLFNLPSPLPPLPPPSAPADGTTISAASGAMRKNAASNEGFDRRGAAGKDRHTKIHTATGPRDRRMRLSLEVARKFFNLQDMLRFDKASQTVQWLLNKSRIAIRELACSISSQNLCSFSHQSSESYDSECEDVASTISDSKGKSAMSQKCAAPSEAKEPKAKRAANRSTRKPLLSNPMLAKAWRAKARERARERTREKKRIMCCSSTSLDAVEDESGPMHNLYLTPQSLEERCLISNSHNYQDCMRSAANCDLQMDGNGGSDLTPILAYDYYNGSTTNILQEQQCDMGTVLLADHACTLYPLN